MITHRIKYKTAALLTLTSLVAMPLFAGEPGGIELCGTTAGTGGVVLEDGAVMLVGQAITGKTSSNDFIVQFGAIHCLTAGPSSCAADIDNSGTIDVVDLLQLLADWGPCVGCASDINEDGQVDVIDLLALLAAWGPC